MDTHIVSAIIGAVSGFVGALIGAFLGPWFQDRLARRRQEEEEIRKRLSPASANPEEQRMLRQIMVADESMTMRAGGERTVLGRVIPTPLFIVAAISLSIILIIISVVIIIMLNR